jgi:hypothetical protein
MKFSIARAIAFVALVLVPGLALADATINPDSPQSLAALWPMLAVGLSLRTLIGLLIPRLSAEFTFFHSARGKAVLTAVGAFVSSIPVRDPGARPVLGDARVGGARRGRRP